MNFLDLIWLIPIFPLIGAAIMLAVGRRLPKSVIRIISPGAILVSFIFSLGAVIQLAGLEHRVHEKILFSWLPLLKADMGYLLDPLSSIMILVITGIGFLIHVYATGYMAHEHGPRDGGYYRFFGYLNLFVFFMLNLVLGNNYPLLFVGWEGVGLCSYLLIGFYFHKKSAGDAGKKAFIVNRIGDAGFILGMFFLFQLTGSLRFVDVNEVLLSGKYSTEMSFGVLSLTALLLFIGATGKSAQLPLYVWLPDAMEGPTPVSALIHAATMVTAGVYMCARSNALFHLTPETSHIVAIVGAATAIFAASIGLVQNDIKRVLAYSTVSQLGYMFLAVGVGAYWVAVFHLYTHAFFKALLFLCSGSVIHAMGGEQDMCKMGGLKDKIPVTFRTMFIGSVAIAGIPGLAGFFSKDEILWQTWSNPELGSKVLWIVGLTTAAMTAFYMWRLMFMTFYGEGRMDDHTKHHIHESPLVMTGPLMVLAAGSVCAGWIGMPKVFGENGFIQGLEHWLAPVFETGHAAAHEAAEHAGAAHHDTSMEWILMGVSVLVAISGILLARHIYLRMKEEDRPTGGALYPVLLNKWYVDEIYEFLFVDGLSKKGGTLLGQFDRTVVDGGVNGTAWLTRMISRVSMWWDTWIVDGLVNLTAFTVRALSFPVRFFQTGFVQSYALVFLAGLFAMFGYFWWVR